MKNDCKITAVCKGKKVNSEIDGNGYGALLGIQALIAHLAQETDKTPSEVLITLKKLFDNKKEVNNKFSEKPRAEMHLEMFEGEGCINHVLKSSGTGEDCMTLIADYIVSVAKDNGFHYIMSLTHIANKCKELAERKEV